MKQPKVAERNRLRVKHGQSRRGAESRTYTLWKAMHRRCKADPHYTSVHVCEDWSQFTNFYEDMGDAPDGYTLERVNSREGYSPENCVWATPSEQNENTSRSWLVSLSGKWVSPTRYAEALGVPRSTVYDQIKSGKVRAIRKYGKKS